jgi:predicted DCC family thiol-disulfide oxidoreductase YuxK
MVQFLLRRDKYDRFRFAPLQSEFAGTLLKKHEIDALDLDSVSLVTDYGTVSEKAFTRSDAVIRASWDLGGGWRIFEVGRMIPRRMRDWFYSRVAGNRYRIFGKYESCPIPRPEDREKFIE